MSKIFNLYFIYKQLLKETNIQEIEKDENNNISRFIVKRKPNQYYLSDKIESSTYSLIELKLNKKRKRPKPHKNIKNTQRLKQKEIDNISYKVYQIEIQNTPVTTPNQILEKRNRQNIIKKGKIHSKREIRKIEEYLPSFQA